MKKIVLKTTADDMSVLWQRVGDLRADAQVVKVEPSLLRNLLLDHQALFALHHGNIQE